MSTMVLSGFGLFGDEVFTSTDLNRRSGEVLNQASVRPVTISRNNELFALLRREHAARLVKVVNRMGCASALLSEVNAVLAGDATSCEDYEWVAVFDRDDLARLLKEVLFAMRHAASGHSDWDEVDALIHQWRESALVAKSGVLDASIFDEAEDLNPLSSPLGSEKFADEALRR